MCHITVGSGVDDETAAKPATTVQDCASVFVPDVFNQKLGRLESRKAGISGQNVTCFFCRNLSRVLSSDLKMRRAAK